MAAKAGMADVLKAVLLSEEDRLHTRERLRTAIASLLAAGRGGRRGPAGVDAADLLLALGGITMIAGAEDQRALATRLIDLLLRGVS